MKKLIIILAILMPFWVLAQNRPLVDAETFMGRDTSYFCKHLNSTERLRCQNMDGKSNISERNTNNKS